MRVQEWSKGEVDAALAIQPGTGSDSIKTVKESGLLITVSRDSKTVIPERNIEVRQMEHQLFTNKEMIELVNDISLDKLKITIEKSFPFEEALEALKKTETRRARGKLAVKLFHT